MYSLYRRPLCSVVRTLIKLLNCLQTIGRMTAMESCIIRAIEILNISLRNHDVTWCDRTMKHAPLGLCLPAIVVYLLSLLSHTEYFASTLIQYHTYNKCISADWRLPKRIVGVKAWSNECSRQSTWQKHGSLQTMHTRRLWMSKPQRSYLKISIWISTLIDTEDVLARLGYNEYWHHVLFKNHDVFSSIRL